MLNVLWLFNGCHSCGSCLSFSLEALLLSLCFQLGLMCNALFLGLLMLMPFSLCCELSLLSGILLLFDTLFFSKCKLLLMMLLSYECFLLVSQSYSFGMCFSFYTQTLSFSMLGFDTQSLSLSMSLSLESQSFLLSMSCLFLSFLLSCLLILYTKTLLFSLVMTNSLSFGFLL